MQTVYIEKKVLTHHRTQAILEKINPQYIVECEHYKEIFNPKSQNFRIQKQQPSLILAEKQGDRVFVSPEGFGIGGAKNYYFSHMLNCIYDCRYCFLQGMYSSANYVIFVNYEDYMDEIKLKSGSATAPVYFFSGYDCDSLAYEPVTHFVKEFLPFFYHLKNAILELRTKSTNVTELLKYPPYQHCVVAFSFTPEEISREIEHKVPSVAKRIQAMKKVAEHGWPIGLRFDPVIYHPHFQTFYEQLLKDIFSHISSTAVHSISIGALRFPEKMFQKIVKLYPEDPLFSQPLYRQQHVFSYSKEVEQKLKLCLHQLLTQYVDQTLLFECQT